MGTYSDIFAADPPATSSAAKGGAYSDIMQPSVFDTETPTSLDVQAQRIMAAGQRPWWDQIVQGLKISGVNAATGIGQFFGDVASRLPQLGPEGEPIGPAPGAPVSAQLRKEQQQRAALAGPELTNPLTFISAMAPDMAMAAYPFSKVGTGIRGLAEAGGLGAGMGAIAPVTEEDQRAKNMIAGALMSTVGQGVAGATGTVARGPTPASPAIEDFIAKGYPLSRGDITGSELMQRVEGLWAMLPGLRKGYQQLDQAQQGQVDQMVAQIVSRDAMDNLKTSGVPFNVADSELQGQIWQAINWAKTQKVAPPTGAVEDVQRFLGTPEQTAPNPAMPMFPSWAGPDAAAKYAAATGMPERIVTRPGEPPLYPPGTQLPMAGPIGDKENFMGMASLYRQRAREAGYNTTDGQVYMRMAQALDEQAARDLVAGGADPSLIGQFKGAYTAERMFEPAGKQLGPGQPTTYGQDRLLGIINAQKNQGKIEGLSGTQTDQARELQSYLQAIQSPRTSKTPEGMQAKDLATGASIPLAWEAITEMAKGGVLGALGKATLFGLPYLAHAATQWTKTGLPGLRATPDWFANLIALTPQAAGPASLPLIMQKQNAAFPEGQ